MIAGRLNVAAAGLIAGLALLVYAAPAQALTLNNMRAEFATSTVEPIPVLAALPLFLSGLGGLGLIGSQRRRTAAVQIQLRES